MKSEETYCVIGNDLYLVTDGCRFRKIPAFVDQTMSKNIAPFLKEDIPIAGKLYVKKTKKLKGSNRRLRFDPEKEVVYVAYLDDKPEDEGHLLHLHVGEVHPKGLTSGQLNALKATEYDWSLLEAEMTKAKMDTYNIVFSLAGLLEGKSPVIVVHDADMRSCGLAPIYEENEDGSKKMFAPFHGKKIQVPRRDSATRKRTKATKKPAKPAVKKRDKAIFRDALRDLGFAV